MRTCSQANRLSMPVLIHVARGVEFLGEGFAVCGESDDGEGNAAIVANTEDLGLGARIDRVAACGTGVACEDGEVAATDAEY